MAEFLSSDPGLLEAHPNTVYDFIANICHDMVRLVQGKGHTEYMLDTRLL